MALISAALWLWGHPISYHVATFHRRMLTSRIVRELVGGFLLVLPFCVLLSHILQRWMVRHRTPRTTSSSEWLPVLVVALFGDLMVEALLQPSLACLSVSADEDDMSAAGTAIVLWKEVLRSWGVLCASPMPQQHEEYQEWSPFSFVLLLGIIRLLFMSAGTYVGQSFMPVALTGSIATGMGYNDERSITFLNSCCVILTHSHFHPCLLTSGKSSVAKLLLEPAETSDSEAIAESKTKQEIRQGTFKIIDLDRIGHEILLSPSKVKDEIDAGQRYSVVLSDSVYPMILKAFGDPKVDNKNILNDDGQIDRRKLGEIIFKDSHQRSVLNRITHPRIRRVMLRQILVGTYHGEENIICADVPLLFESGWLRWLFSLVIVVACERDLQLHRLCRRNPDLSKQQCRDRVASQIPVEKKVALADIVIWNNGNLEDLSKEVDRVRTETVDRLFGGYVSLFLYLVIFGGAFLVVASSKLFR